MKKVDLKNNASVAKFEHEAKAIRKKYGLD